MKSGLGIRSLFLAAFVLTASLYPASAAFSEEVIALVTIRHEYYEEAMKGVESSCNCTLKPYFLEGRNKIDILNEVRAQSPKVLLAVGAHGLMAAKEIEGIPIVYSSVTKSYNILTGKEDNIIGVSMDVPIDQQLTKFIEFAPRVTKIGFIYDPKNNGREAETAKATAKALGVELVAREVERPTQVIDAIEEIRKKVNAFWVLPDITSSFHFGVKYLMDVSVEEWVPILIFSKKYLDMGATVSVNINQFSLGRDAGLMLKDVIAGIKPQDVPPPGPRKLELNINTVTASKLGLIQERSTDRIVTLVSLIK